MNSAENPEFIQFLYHRLLGELPGWNDQLRLSPYPVREKIPPFEKSADTRRSGALVLLLPTEQGDDFQIVFTLRSGNLKHHRGQISFPGGRSDDKESPAETALRETWEEVGIPSENIRILGELTPLYVPVSNSVIHPVVAWLPFIPQFLPEPREVEEVFTVRVSEFLKPERFRREQWQLGNRELLVPFWEVHRVPLWGASAMILREFLTIYEEFSAK